MIYFSAEFVRELQMLVRSKSATDLPAEIVKQVPALLEGRIPSEREESRSANGSTVHSCFRVGSRKLSRGKKGGFRVHIARTATGLRFVYVYFKPEKKYLDQRQQRELEKRLREDAISRMSAEWRTLAEFCEIFGLDLPQGVAAVSLD